MDIRSLHYFLVVARVLHITKAAELLHISQPSLSVQIQQLEAELGKPLLIREKRHLSLTPDGELLCKRAEEILSLVAKTKNELQSTADHIGGDLMIASGEREALQAMIQVASSLRQDYPQIRWHFFMGDAVGIAERMDHGIVDFAIFLEPVDVTKYEHLHLPMTMTWGILLRKSSPLAEKEAITADDMAGLPLILPERMDLRRQSVGWLNKDVEELPVVATYNLIHLTLSLVSAGFGYAVVLDKLVDIQHKSDLCFRPIAPTRVVQVSLVWKKYRPLSKQSQIFLDRVRKFFRQQGDNNCKDTADTSFL